MYTLINFINVDYVIADKNITRYHNKQKLDINYLCNYHADNMPLLVDLYNETNDYKIKIRHPPARFLHAPGNFLVHKPTI